MNKLPSFGIAYDRMQSRRLVRYLYSLAMLAMPVCTIVGIAEWRLWPIELFGTFVLLCNGYMYTAAAIEIRRERDKKLVQRVSLNSNLIR
jgi:hypothetical protein